MKSGNSGIYEFGEYTLDVGERTLKKNGTFIPLAPKVMDTLVVLAAREGSILSKRELMDAVWPDAFVEESNLSQNIYTLRRVLGNGSGGHDIIENVPRRGYRFNAPVPVYADETSSPVDAPAFPTRSRRLVPVLAILSLVGAGALAYLWFARSPAAQTERRRAPAETVNLRKLTLTGDADFPVLAPDGRSFAFVRGDQIIVQDVESGKESPLSINGKSRFGMLQFSSDSASIYFREPASPFAGDIYHVSRYGGVPELIVEDVAGGIGFSPDGRQMAFFRYDPRSASGPSLYTRSVDTRVERKLTTFARPGFLFAGHPAWSTDGKKLATVMFDRSSSNEVSQLAVYDMDSGQLREIATQRLRQIEQPVWLYGDNELAVIAREPGKFLQVWRIEPATGKATRITNDLNTYRGLSVSADGKRLLTRQHSFYSHIWVAEKDRIEQPVQKTFENMNRDAWRGIEWLSTGELVYNARATGEQDIWISAADGARKQLTKNAGDQNQNPAASPDGRHIYFSSNRTGSIHIWRMNADGSEQVQVTFGKENVETFPQISHDGRTLYYIRRGPAGRFVVSHDLTTRSETTLTENPVVPAGPLRLSPDGNSLAFLITAGGEEDESGDGYQIGIISVSAPSSLRSVNLKASRPAIDWAPGGTAFDYIESNDSGSRLMRQPLDDGPPVVLAVYPEKYLHTFRWSEEGRRLALALGKQLSDAILLTEF